MRTPPRFTHSRTARGRPLGTKTSSETRRNLRPPIRCLWITLSCVRGIERRSRSPIGIGCMQARCHYTMDMREKAATPRIACLPNGPYYLLHEMQPAPVPHLVRSSGAQCATVRGVALCRCGGSKNKPFCDGTHSTIGFSDRRPADGADNRRESYRGKRITIFDN